MGTHSFLPRPLRRDKSKGYTIFDVCKKNDSLVTYWYSTARVHGSTQNPQEAAQTLPAQTQIFLRKIPLPTAGPPHATDGKPARKTRAANESRRGAN